MDKQVSGDSSARVDRTSIRVRRAIEGDVESLGWIVEHISPLLLSQARYRLSKHLQGIYDPEDLVQDVWMTALPKLDVLESREHRMTPVLLKYLSRVLLNHYRNLLHKHVHGKPLRLPLEGTVSGPEEGGALVLSIDHSDALEKAMQSELCERVLASIENLERTDREIVILRGVEQSTNHEAALVLRIEPGTVAVRYHRALLKLRNALPASIFDELPLEGD